jgi:uncharacterized membrane protein YedE/YeeE
MENFTPLQSAIGGAMVGLSTFLVLFFQARVAGISGIAGSLFAPERGDIGWRVAFIVGMVATGAVLGVLWPALFGEPTTSRGTLVVAGLLVGIGTRLGNGCTSGHGVCGLSRLSRRSMVATALFMGTAALTVLFSRLLKGDPS